MEKSPREKVKEEKEERGKKSRRAEREYEKSEKRERKSEVDLKIKGRGGKKGRNYIFWYSFEYKRKTDYTRNNEKVGPGKD